MYFSNTKNLGFNWYRKKDFFDINYNSADVVMNIDENNLER